MPVLRIDSFELQSSNKLTTDALHGIHDVATPPMAVEPGYGSSMLNFITPMLQLWTSSGPYVWAPDSSVTKNTGQ